MFRSRAAFAFMGTLMVAACSTSPHLPLEEKTEVRDEEPPAAPPPVHLKYLDHRNLKPMPITPLNVTARCAHKDDIGTRTRLNLKVKDAKVNAFNARIQMAQGTCQFDLDNFKQTGTLPLVVLNHRQHADCTVRMWSQDDQITIAYTACPQVCTGDSFDYLWPILVNRRNGRCD